MRPLSFVMAGFKIASPPLLRSKDFVKRLGWSLLTGLLFVVSIQVLERVSGDVEGGGSSFEKMRTPPPTRRESLTWPRNDHCRKQKIAQPFGLPFYRSSSVASLSLSTHGVFDP